MRIRFKLTKSQGNYKELEDKVVCGVSHFFKGDKQKQRFQTIPVAKLPFGKYYLESHPCPPKCSYKAKVKSSSNLVSQSRNNCC